MKKLVQLRVTDDEWAWLSRIASESGSSIAATLRRVIAKRRADSRERLDADALEARVTERVRDLEVRVADLEREVERLT